MQDSNKFHVSESKKTLMIDSFNVNASVNFNVNFSFLNFLMFNTPILETSVN